MLRERGFIESIHKYIVENKKEWFIELNKGLETGDFGDKWKDEKVKFFTVRHLLGEHFFKTLNDDFPNYEDITLSTLSLRINQKQ